METSLLVGVTSILVLGIGAQWISWQLRLPSILIMLIFGVLAGPVAGVLSPDAIFGELLFPLVSVFVGVVLFEGGLNLEFDELKKRGGVIHGLILIGVAVTWILSSVAAHLILGFSWPIAVLQGAILVVTGPTVVIPLLQYIRPTGRISSIARWEGIMNDPIGAILAVIVFEAIVTGSFGSANAAALRQFVETILVGSAIGAIGAALLILPLTNYWIPDYLENSVTLMMVVAVFTASNLLHHESGLLATTIMGIVLANQPWRTVHHIIEFKEDLRVLLLSTLFIILAARLEPSYLTDIDASALIFLGVLIVLIRPLAMVLSTARSDLEWEETAFLSWLAPRGIVAAAVSAIFAEELVNQGYPEAEALVPVTFLVIAGTVALYGLTAGPLARWLGLADPDPQGFLIVGAHEWARDIARVLNDEGFQTRLVDANPHRVQQAHREGLEAVRLNILSENQIDQLDLSGMGHLLSVTSNDEANSLAVLHCRNIFESSETFQIAPHEFDEEEDVGLLPEHLRGRLLFEPPVNFEELSLRYEHAGELQTIALSEEYTYQDFQDQYGSGAVAMFLIDPDQETASIFTRSSALQPKPGDRIVALVNPDHEEPEQVEVGEAAAHA